MKSAEELAGLRLEACREIRRLYRRIRTIDALLESDKYPEWYIDWEAHEADGFPDPLDTNENPTADFN